MLGKNCVLRGLMSEPIFLKRPPSPERKGDFVYKGLITHTFFGIPFLGGLWLVVGLGWASMKFPNFQPRLKMVFSYHRV